MALSFDPEIEIAVKAAAEAAGDYTPPPRGDALALREGLHALMGSMVETAPVPPDVTRKDYQTVAQDGTAIDLHWYSKAGAQPGSAVLYVHGGGMICGTLDLYRHVLNDYVSLSVVPMLAVEYRLAP